MSGASNPHHPSEVPNAPYPPLPYAGFGIPDLISEITSDAVLDDAYLWLCERRKNYWHNNDVWTLRWQWPQVKARIKLQLLAGAYRFDSLHLIHNSADHVALWSSRDILVQKAISIVLTRHLTPLLPKTCRHFIGNGGVKATVRAVVPRLSGNDFVFRSDVLAFYATIDHDILFNQLKQYVTDPRILDLLWQFMRRRIYDAGLYEDIKVGISLGCPLSPLMAAIYLKPLDEKMAELGLFYARFMDDWVVLAPTRWKLRESVRRANQVLSELKVRQHPGKTFIGRVSRGFDFLGYRITPDGPVGPAGSTIRQSVERMNQLYEQGVVRHRSPQASQIRIGEYARRWWSWVRGGPGARFPGADAWLVPDAAVDALRRCGVSPTISDSTPAKKTRSAQTQQRHAPRLGDDLGHTVEGVDRPQREGVLPGVRTGHEESRTRLI